MAQRGFLAEINHQLKLEQQRRAREQREVERLHRAALRDAERTRKAEERAKQALLRAEAAEKKELEKQAKLAHVAAMEAEAEEKNTHLAAIIEEIDSLLAATLMIDDYVDLESLRQTVDHPPFSRPDLDTPTVITTVPPNPSEPICPTPKKGVIGALTRTRYENQLAIHNAWQQRVAQLEQMRQSAQDEYSRAESARMAAIASARAKYDQECFAREVEVNRRNEALDRLISNLGYGTAEAVEEYVSIVLSNSIYPDHFQVSHDFSFDVSTAELQLRVGIPGPGALPTIKSYRYNKSSDEIVSSSLSNKVCKDRYASAIHQVALRSLHEVFEADRRGIIKAITLQTGTFTTNPATGNKEYFCFVAAAADRENFLTINLPNVIPSATLDHLGAQVSKNPYELVTVDPSGVRQA